MQKTRKTLVAAVVAALVLGAAVGATAESVRRSIEVDYSGISIKVDGKTLDTGNAQPFVVVEEGRTYVPARPLAEALNTKVGYDAATRTVLVYTPSYLDTKTEGSLTTYTFPYYGVSMKLPSGGRLDTSTVMLSVEYPDSLVLLNRVRYLPSLGFDRLVAGALAGMRSMVPVSVTREEAISFPGASAAKDLIGTTTSQGISIPVRMRFVAVQDNLWILLAMSNPQADPDGNKAKEYLSAFSVGQ